jgi:high affinity Mn2+ porin
MSSKWVWSFAIAMLWAGSASAQNFDRAAPGQDKVAESPWFAVHGQATVVVQGHDAFRSPYRGDQSLDPAARAAETADLTLYAGLKPWRGAEIWINPEIDQGFGLSNTLGVAGYVSGEAYKVGQSTPYLKLPRLFLRQTVDLGGERETVDSDLNVLGGARSSDRLVLTVGKFGVPDVFDTNTYAHDPRQDFLNWALIDTGTFDYAADAWGFTFGAAAEWYKGPWTLRAGWFDLSNVPNSTSADLKFQQYQWVGEAERRYQLDGRKGKLAVTAFDSHGRMARFEDAVAMARATGLPADVGPVRRMRERAGVSVNLEQSLAGELAAFARAGVADGAIEPYEFADIDRTLAVGVSEGGKAWGRADDRAAAALLVNGISGAHKTYLAAGGDGILVGDGRLPHAGAETVMEAWYSLAVAKGLHATLDYQFVSNPAYNRDRGPVSILGLRLHAQY